MRQPEHATRETRKWAPDPMIGRESGSAPDMAWVAAAPRRPNRCHNGRVMLNGAHHFHSLRIVRHVPAGEGEQYSHGNSHVRQGNPPLSRIDPPSGRQDRPRGRRRRVPRSGRPLRLREVHRSAHARRPRRGQRGSHPHRRPRCHRRAPEGSRHRDGLPELRPLPAHDRRREHRLRAQDRRRQQGRARARASSRPPSCSTSSRYLDRKPKALSGGQRQRVAMGRAIVRSRRSSSWTSRCRTSTPSSACRPAPRSRRSRAASASPPSTSRTTRSRR